MRSRFTLHSLRAAGIGDPGDGRPIQVDEIPAGESTDEATARTVAKMCEYVRASIADPQVRAAAQYASTHFAMGDRSPASLVWAVFWYVKHCVKFRQDEATMFRVGREHEYDLLIAPAVLVRMQDPAEDCDGFTMLTAALCAILGLPVYIATVAVSPGEPDRWSHVFAIAMVNGSVVPLDTSHGSGPGWMVPRERIYRFQAWDLDGRPVDLEPSKFRGLHGYVRNGMGDDSSDDVSNLLPYIDTSDSSNDLSNLLPYLSSTSAPASTAASSGPSLSTDLTNFFTALTGQAASVAKVAETPVTTITLPNGTVVSGVSPGAAGSLLSSSSLSSLLPILGIGLVALLAFSFIGGKK